MENKIIPKGYFRESHNPYYSIVAALPLLVIYEVLLAITQSGYWQTRNAADVWLRNILTMFNLTSQQMFFVMMTILMVLIPFAHVKYGALKWKFFAFVLIESLVYSVLFGMVIRLILSPIFMADPMSGGLLQNIALSIGAGLFEEFMFRVVLLNVLFFVLKPFLKSIPLSALIAILTASFIFSASHYVGSLSDPFGLYSFLFRWIAGLMFTAIYFLRGFAVAAYTHAFYDIWVFI
ncbi:MAG: CPBP family intramembrane metalloprotease [SAR324 cluster bacterium]|nr:CPBP family intramembrane metalloprotease [SAR324 cluster bacterium]